jgi:hypothetical protein
MNMRYLLAFLVSASIAAAYITPPDQVLIDGRILLTSSRPLATFPWRGERPRLSEHPYEGASDSRELEALWEIKDGRLYLLAVSAFRFDGFAGNKSVGLHDLMSERIQDGRVFAEWFTGNLDVIERERVEKRLLLQPKQAPPMRVVIRKFRVVGGKVTEEPNQSDSAPRLVEPAGLAIPWRPSPASFR